MEAKYRRSVLHPWLWLVEQESYLRDFFWTDADNHDVPVNFAFLQQLEAAMMQAMVVHGFSIHERQRQMKSEVALLTDVNAIAEYPVGWSERK